MNLYILRHASAGSRRSNAKLDLKRPLDKLGKEQCVLVANYLNSLKVQFDLIVSSPLKRALQTASLVGTESGYELKIRISDTLAPSGSVAGFQRLISQLAAYENVLVVGHNPNISQFLSSCCSTGRLNVRMRKGALALVDIDSGSGQLLWLITPRALRQIYASMTKSSRRKELKGALKKSARK